MCGNNNRVVNMFGLFRLLFEGQSHVGRQVTFSGCLSTTFSISNTRGLLCMSVTAVVNRFLSRLTSGATVPPKYSLPKWASILEKDTCLPFWTFPIAAF